MIYATNLGLPGPAEDISQRWHALGGASACRKNLRRHQGWSGCFLLLLSALAIAVAVRADDDDAALTKAGSGLAAWGNASNLSSLKNVVATQVFSSVAVVGGHLMSKPTAATDIPCSFGTSVIQLASV